MQRVALKLPRPLPTLRLAASRAAVNPHRQVPAERLAPRHALLECYGHCCHRSALQEVAALLTSNILTLLHTNHGTTHLK
jgi:hypothetical protein